MGSPPNPTLSCHQCLVHATWPHKSNTRRKKNKQQKHNTRIPSSQAVRLVLFSGSFGHPGLIRRGFISSSQLRMAISVSDLINIPLGAVPQHGSRILVSVFQRYPSTKVIQHKAMLMEQDGNMGAMTQQQPPQCRLRNRSSRARVYRNSKVTGIVFFFTEAHSFQLFRWIDGSHGSLPG